MERGMIAFALRLLLGLVALAPPELEGEEDDGFVAPVEWRDAPAFAAGHDQLEIRMLEGQVLPNLVQIANLNFGVQGIGIESARSRYDGPVTLVITGTLTHPFESAVTDTRIRALLFSPEELKKTWRRLMANPLELTDVEINATLPRPRMSWSRQALDENSVAPNEAIDINRTSEVQDFPVEDAAWPHYLIMLDGYRLEDPTASDIERIIEAGGVSDLSAIVTWLEENEIDYGKFNIEEQERLVKSLYKRLDSMRAPLRYGDLMRLHTLLRLVRVLSRPEDLDHLLGMDRSMQILLTGVGLAYHDAMDEENRLEVPVHNLRHLPSVVEFMDAYKNALQDIRRSSIPRLLELAFDPVDFRNAPKDQGLSVSNVQAQARSLLEPQIPTNAADLLRVVEDDYDAQRSIIEFFIRVRHVAAAAPLLRWLGEHPSEVESLGLRAAREMGRPLAPVLLRDYLEPQDSTMREIARAMLLALPPEAAPDIVEALRAAGVVLADDMSAERALSFYEERERIELSRQADIAERIAFTDPPSAHTTFSRMNAIAQLAKIAPKRLELHATEAITLLTTAAEALDTESPAESTRAMEMLENLPLGRSALNALDSLAIVRAKIALNHENPKLAREQLLDHDPELREVKIRRAYGDITENWSRAQMGRGMYSQAIRLAKDGQRRIPDDPRFEVLLEEIFWAEYWPAIILGGISGSVLSGTLSFLLARSVQKWLTRRRKRKLEVNQAQLRRRKVIPGSDDEKLAALEAELAARYASDDDDDELGLSNTVAPADDPASFEFADGATKFNEPAFIPKVERDVSALGTPHDGVDASGETVVGLTPDFSGDDDMLVQDGDEDGNDAAGQEELEGNDFDEDTGDGEETEGLSDRSDGDETDDENEESEAEDSTNDGDVDESTPEDQDARSEADSNGEPSPPAQVDDEAKFNPTSTSSDNEERTDDLSGPSGAFESPQSNEGDAVRNNREDSEVQALDRDEDGVDESNAAPNGEYDDDTLPNGVEASAQAPYSDESLADDGLDNDVKNDALYADDASEFANEINRSAADAQEFEGDASLAHAPNGGDEDLPAENGSQAESFGEFDELAMDVAQDFPTIRAANDGLDSDSEDENAAIDDEPSEKSA
jgi:hypothetical protein